MTRSLYQIALFITTFLFFVCPSGNPASGADAVTQRPNVVLLIADDLGWNAVEYHGGFVKTPNIDRIVHEGVELDRFYVSPMCSPTRAGLLTGRYPMRFGMARSVVRPWAKYGLPPEERTIPEALAAAGYANRAAFGKWHLGHLDPKWHPLSQGFTEFRGCYNGAIDYFTRDRDGQRDWHFNWDDVDQQGYTTDLIADSAVEFVRKHAKEPAPFVCYVAFTAPHEPLEAPQKYLDQYTSLAENGRPSEKQKLAAMTACMDDGIGRILKAIEDAGIARNTLIWFISDNGGIGTIPGNNFPLHGAKLSVYEGGVRVPSAVWQPGNIEGGRKVSTPIVNVDVMPTILAQCGAAGTPSPKPMDGLDVSEVLHGRPAPDALASRDVYSFTGQAGIENEQIAIASADGWKLIVIGPDIRRAGGIEAPKHRIELYHLSEDPLEKHDVAASEPDRVKALSAKLIAFRTSEPPNPLRPINRKPADFQPPVNWHNGPRAATKTDAK